MEGVEREKGDWFSLVEELRKEASRLASFGFRPESLEGGPPIIRFLTILEEKGRKVEERILGLEIYLEEDERKEKVMVVPLKEENIPWLKKFPLLSEWPQDALVVIRESFSQPGAGPQTLISFPTPGEIGKATEILREAVETSNETTS